MATYRSDDIRLVVDEFLHPRPRPVCICGRFAPAERDPEFLFVRCANCAGWMSEERIARAGRR